MDATEVESRVSSVTVYQGRAMITRETAVSLEAGDHTLVFTGLPSGLDPCSLQVRGTGEATLGECVFETEHFTEEVDSRIRPLLDRKQDLSDELAGMEARLQLLAGEKSFVERIAGYVTSPQPVPDNSAGVAVSPGIPDVSHWKGLADFYRERHNGINKEKLDTERKIREIGRELKKTEAELSDLGNRSTRSRDIIRVGLNKKKAGDVTLHLSYLVSGPSWKPVYNLRASTGSGKLMLEYDALVTQATGEDWRDIELRLSTARINVSGVLPKLHPWHIAFYQPQPLPVSKSAYQSKTAMPHKNEVFDLAAQAPAAGAQPAEQEVEIVYEEASVDRSGASVLFNVAGGGSVTGDNRETRVALARKELPAEYLYRSVPKFSEFAYLTARMTNDSEFPILPGCVNILQDGSLVARSVFDLIMPEQKADVSLGVDEGVKVEYRFIKRFRKNEGLINKRISEQFEYSIRLTNNLGREIDLQVYDQFPISGDKELEVKAVQPEIREGREETKLDDEARITWNLKLAPAEKLELPVVYLVEYPVGRKLRGL